MLQGIASPWINLVVHWNERACQMFHYKTFQKWKKVNYTIISNHFWMLLLAHNLTYRIDLCYCVSTDLYLGTRRRHHIFSRVSTDASSRRTLREELRGVFEEREPYLPVHFIFSHFIFLPHFWRDIRSGAARLMRCRSQAERGSNEDEGRIPPLKAPVFQRASARWEQSRSRLSRGINRSEKPREHPQLLPLSPSE